MLLTLFRTLYNALMRASIPLLLAMAAVTFTAIPPTLKWATTARSLHKAQGEIAELDVKAARLGTDLASCRSNTDRLTDALEIQNQAVDALKAESDARTVRADAAIRRAQDQARRYRERAERIARAIPSDDVCDSARSLIVEALNEDRS